MMKITELASRTQGATTGAAFLMATSAIGPGFLTQTAVFTSVLGTDFAFAILASVLVDLAVQVNVWRVLGVARRRGQEPASAVPPGVGTALAPVVAGGGLPLTAGDQAGGGLVAWRGPAPGRVAARPRGQHGNRRDRPHARPAVPGRARRGGPGGRARPGQPPRQRLPARGGRVGLPRLRDRPVVRLDHVGGRLLLHL